MPRSVPVWFLPITALLLGAACQRVQVDGAEAPDGTRATASPGKPDRAQPLPGGTPLGARARPLPSAVLLRADEVVRRDPAFVALSREEAEWLQAEGFPTREALASLVHLDPAELLRRARDHGDRQARILLGHRHMVDGDVDGALRAFDIAARDGSLHALEQLAFAELRDATGWTPGSAIQVPPWYQVHFVARMEQARLLGDHRVDYYIRQLAPGFDFRRYGGDVMAQSQEFMRQLGEDAALRRRTLRIRSRPGIDAWQQIASTPASQTVPVFAPGP